MVFPLPSKRSGDGRILQWPRHGHSGKLNANMQNRAPSLIGWARPAFERAALPPLSLLPAKCPVSVLPGDKLFQSDTLQEGFMNPIIFHGYSGSKDRWGKELQKAANKGILPMAVCLLGSPAVPPLCQHSSGSKILRASNAQLSSNKAVSAKLS